MTTEKMRSREDILLLNKKLVKTIEDVLRLNKLYIGQSALDDAPKVNKSKSDKSKESKLIFRGSSASRMAYDVIAKSSKPIHVSSIVYSVKELCKKQNVKPPSSYTILRSLAKLSNGGAISRVTRGLYSRKKSIDVLIPKLSKKDALIEVLGNADAPLTLKEIHGILSAEYDHEPYSNTIALYLYRWGKEGIVKRSKDGWTLVKDKKVEGKEKKVVVNKKKVEARSEAILDIFSNSAVPLLIREVMNILEKDYPSVPKGGYDTTNKMLRSLLKRGLIQRLAPGVYSRV